MAEQETKTGKNRDETTTIGWSDFLGTYEDKTVEVIASHYHHILFSAEINGKIATIRITIDQVADLTDEIDSGTYNNVTVDVVAQNKVAEANKACVDDEDDPFRCIHAQFSIDGVEVEASVEQVHRGSRTGEKIWAAYWSGYQPTPEEIASLD